MAVFDKNKRLCEQSIIKLSEGDMSALSVLYDCIGKLLFSIAYSILNDYHLAEDAMQDTFLKIAEQANEHSRGTNAKAWIAAICRNSSLNVLKKRGFEIANLDETERNEHAGANTVYGNEAFNIELHDMLSSLSISERQIIVFRVFGKLKHTEIATLMGIKPATARQKYQRTLNKLRNEYFLE